MTKSDWTATAIFIAGWVVSRLVVLHQFLGPENFMSSDVYYYFGQVAESGTAGLVEYPTPIAVFALALYGLAGGSAEVFVSLFIGIAIATDALVTAAMWRSGHRLVAGYWAVFMFIVGPLVWLRLDIFSAAAVAQALLWLMTRPRLSGAMIAVGAATKLWPAILAFPSMGTGPKGRRRTLSFVAVGAVLGIASLVFFGWERSVSPLTWQSDRGLQIESIAASGLMARHAFDDVPTRVFFSDWNAYEVTGPGVTGWLLATDIAMLVTIVIALILSWLIATAGIGVFSATLATERRLDDSAQRGYAITLAFIAIISLVIVSNKTFSPQYMMWLAGPLAMLVAYHRGDQRHSSNIVIMVLGLVVAALTHVVYPYVYPALTEPSSFQEFATVILLFRNVLMIMLAVVSTGLATREAVAFAKSNADHAVAS